MFLWLYLTLKSDGTMEQSFPMGVCEALILVMQRVGRIYEYRFLQSFPLLTL